MYGLCDCLCTPFAEGVPVFTIHTPSVESGTVFIHRLSGWARLNQLYRYLIRAHRSSTTLNLGIPGLSRFRPIGFPWWNIAEPNLALAGFLEAGGLFESDFELETIRLQYLNATLGLLC